ncbi:Rho GTPase activation protein, partial [Lactarius psammicola]
MSTRAQVEKTLAETETSNLRASFRHALSFSIPPLTPYRNYRPGAYSDLIFGVPLVDLTTNEDNVPKVMRMCIEEVEKRGLNTKNIYSVSSRRVLGFMLSLGRRVESEKSFSFSPTDNIYSVAALLMRYLWDLPEPLFTLSLQDYRNYGQNRARYTGNDFSLLRSKIRELHPIQRASLGALSRHLLRVASHSDKNATTVGVLLAEFSYAVLRGNVVLQEGIHVKTLVMEDLIQHAQTLFDENRPPSSPVPSPDVARTSSTLTHGLHLGPEFPRLKSAEAKFVDSTTLHLSTSTVASNRCRSP